MSSQPFNQREIPLLRLLPERRPSATFDAETDMVFQTDKRRADCNGNVAESTTNDYNFGMSYTVKSFTVYSSDGPTRTVERVLKPGDLLFADLSPREKEVLAAFDEWTLNNALDQIAEQDAQHPTTAGLAALGFRPRKRPRP